MSASAVTAAPARAAADQAPRRGGRRRRRRQTIAAYGFLLPAIALFTAFFLIPFGYAFDTSLKASKVSGGGIGLRTESYVGLGNFQEVLGSHEFYAGLGRMLLYALIVVPIMLGLALLFALILDSKVASARSFSRIAIFLPYAVPGVVATLLWGFLYLPSTSPLTDLSHALGGPTLNFLEGDVVFAAVANVAIWGGTGFNMVVMYTSLKAISSELYDAARIDGCGEWQLAWRIKIPLLTPALVMTGVFSVIATLQVFGEPATLRPLSNSISSTWMPMLKIYRDAFVDADPYLASAGSLILAALMLTLSLGSLKLLQGKAFGEDR